MKEYNIENRRYIGSKAKLIDWIFKYILSETKGNTFLDIFSGTGIISYEAIKYYDKVIINDFLYSNYMIYNSFFKSERIGAKKVISIIEKFNNLNIDDIDENYFSINFANKYFGVKDSKKIGYIREEIEKKYNNKKISKKEKYILISSLIYSIDKIANTVGHYEAYRKKDIIKDNLFKMGLIKPLKHNKKIEIFREDANKLAEEVKADIVFIDPPYNSRQYSRFYHVLENLVKWEKPELYGVALKPQEENMSLYCRSEAPIAFDDLIQKLDCKYIVVTYNNTYKSKSSSSRNKISYEQILDILNRKGETKVFEKEHSFFNAGKTEFLEHKEFLFITEVGKK